MPNYRIEGRCEVLTGGLVISNKCEMPKDSSCVSCPIAVPQTGDRSFAQALSEYREAVAQNLASLKA